MSELTYMKILIPTVIIALDFLLTGCSLNAGDSAIITESYLKALVDQDVNQVVSLSCADWEEQAILEVDSLLSVSASLDNVSCKEVGNDGDTVLVVCSGNIMLAYEEEVQEIDLSRRTYLMKYEGGDWRVCGYK